MSLRHVGDWSDRRHNIVLHLAVPGQGHVWLVCLNGVMPVPARQAVVREATHLSTEVLARYLQ